MGTLSMAALCPPTLRTISYIAGKYSLRRKVIDASTGLPRPIISFSTQYIPVTTAIAHAFVSAAFLSSVHTAFRDPKLGSTMKHFLAAVSKVTVFGHLLKDLMALGDRCGAQGLLRANQLDSFIVCIGSFRLFIEQFPDLGFYLERDQRRQYCGRRHPRNLRQIRHRLGVGTGRTTSFQQSWEPFGTPRSRCHPPIQVAPLRGSRIYRGSIKFSSKTSDRSCHPPSLRPFDAGSWSPHGL